MAFHATISYQLSKGFVTVQPRTVTRISFTEKNNPEIQFSRIISSELFILSIFYPKLYFYFQ